MLTTLEQKHSYTSLVKVNVTNYGNNIILLYNQTDNYLWLVIFIIKKINYLLYLESVLFVLQGQMIGSLLF